MGSDKVLNALRYMAQEIAIRELDGLLQTYWDDDNYEYEKPDFLIKEFKEDFAKILGQVVEEKM